MFLHIFFILNLFFILSIPLYKLRKKKMKMKKKKFNNNQKIKGKCSYSDSSFYTIIECIQTKMSHLVSRSPRWTTSIFSRLTQPEMDTKAYSSTLFESFLIKLNKGFSNEDVGQPYSETSLQPLNSFHQLSSKKNISNPILLSNILKV